MASDMFLKLEAPGLTGESQDETYKGQIEIKSWGWEIAQTGTMGSGGGGGAAKATINDITFSKNMDLATPTLARMCLMGTHIPKGTLVQRKASGDKPMEFLKVEMEHIIVSSVAHTSDGEIPAETLKLNFAKFKLYYLEQDTTTGAPSGRKDEVGYDLKANKKY